MIAYAMRLAEDRDTEQMAAIASSNPTAVKWTAAQFRDLLQPRAAGGTICRALFVAEQAGEVAGFAVVSALCHIYPVEAELESIAVAPALQGHGIGRDLLEATLDWAWAQRALNLRLEVRAGNRRALHMYKVAGFLEIGTRPGYYAAPAEDAVLMERAVPASHGDLSACTLA